MPRSHRLLRSVDTRSTAPLRGVGCCGRWRPGPPGRSEAWAVVVGGDQVHRAAQRRGLLWSVETRFTGPLRGVGWCGRWRPGPPRRSEAWAVVVGGDQVHRAAQRRGLLWSVETRFTGPLRGVGWCGRWRPGPPRRSEAWAVVVGGDQVHRAAQRRGLLWSVETRSTGPLKDRSFGLWRPSSPCLVLAKPYPCKTFCHFRRCHRGARGLELTNYLVSELAGGQGARASRPSRSNNLKPHGRDGHAPWKNRAKPRFYCLFNCMDTAKASLHLGTKRLATRQD